MRRLSLFILPLAFAACGTVAAPASSVPPSSEPVASEGAPRNAVVVITDTGFEPKESTVSASNGTVTFVNKGTEVHQPMSDPHPAHDVLPGLASPELTEGSSYSFTFSKKGDWAFHDEKNPEFTGVIHAK